MLNKSERHHVLTFLRRFCTAGVFPVEVDLDTWELHPGVKAAWKKLACQLSFGTFVAHTLYKALSLVYALLFLRDTPLYQMVIHMIIAGCALTLSFWYYVLYIQYPGINAVLVRMTLTATATGGDSSLLKEPSGKRGIMRVREYSLQDLIVICLPYMEIFAAPVIGASLIYEPTMNMLLYSMLPKGWKIWPCFMVCFMEELRLIIICISVAVPAWQIQVISFDLVNANLEAIAGHALKSTWRSSTGEVKEAYRCLRCLQLYVMLLNIVNRNLIFTWKLLSIGLSILSGYAAITHFKDYPVFGMMYYLICFQATFIYVIVYEKGFKVPHMFQKAKTELHRRTRRSRNAAEWKTQQRQLMSIPLVGVKVGQFHMLERISTPVFLHYVVYNIVSMLVAFD